MSTNPTRGAPEAGSSFFEFCSSARRVPEEPMKSFFDSISEFFGLGCVSRRGGASVFSKERIAIGDREKLLKNLFKAFVERAGATGIQDFERRIRADISRATTGVVCKECYIFKESNKTELKQVDQRIDQANPITAFALFEGIFSKDIADFLQVRIQAIIPPLVHAGLSPKEVLTRAFHELEANVLSLKGYEAMGANGVVSIIDHETAMIYTATLGNSRAYLINKGAKRGLISLSNVRNFSSKKDITRLDRALKVLHKSRADCYIPFSGEYRWPNTKEGVPHSRALGLVAYNSCSKLDKSLWPISAKPKITCCPLKGNDTLVMGTKPFFEMYPIELFEEAIGENPKSDLQHILLKAMPLGREIKEFAGVAIVSFNEKRG